MSTKQAEHAVSIRDRIAGNQMRLIQKDEENMMTLLPEADPARRKFPESEFRKHFLPIFSGEAYERLPPGYTAERLSNEARRYWTQVAGSLGAEVEVVEPDGSTAFIFPALQDTSALNIAQPPDSPTLRHLNAEVLERSQGSPDLANRQMINGLSHQLAYLTSVSRPDEKAVKEKVRKIREYYKLPLDPVATKHQEAPGAQNFMGEMSFDD